MLETYTHLNNIAGFPRYFKIFSQSSDRKRAALLVNNDNVANQISDEDEI